jgi:hypothetical protein
MSDFQQLTHRLAPVLVTLTDEPYWVCLCAPPAGGENTPNEPVFEFWVGAGFDDWFPEDDCTAIFAVTAATVCTGPVRRSPRRRSHAWKDGRVSAPFPERARRTAHWSCRWEGGSPQASHVAGACSTASVPNSAFLPARPVLTTWTSVPGRATRVRASEAGDG